MAGDEQGVGGWGCQVEHQEEFAYTSQMKWHSSCRNIKMIQIILKRVCQRQSSLETCRGDGGCISGEI